ADGGTRAGRGSNRSSPGGQRRHAQQAHTRRTNAMRLFKAGAVLAALTLAGARAACDASPPSSSGSSGSSTLTISNENGALWTCDFSPFNGSDTLLSVGFVYETLAYDNPLQSGKTTPMLAR